MKIPFIDGRDFRPSDAYPRVAIVNDAFAKQYFSGEDPIGKWFEETPSRAMFFPKRRQARAFTFRSSHARSRVCAIH